MRVSALVFGLLLLCPAAGRAQPLCPAGLSDRIKEYERLIDGYRSGASSAIDAWLVWTAKDAHVIIEQADAKCDPLKPWTDAEYRAAAMLAADAAERLLDSANVTLAMTQFEFGGMLFRKAGARLFPFASRWFEAAAVSLRWDVFLGEADAVLSTARQLIPRDPRIVYQSGVTAAFLTIANATALDVFAREPLPPAGSLRAEQSREVSTAKRVV